MKSFSIILVLGVVLICKVAAQSNSVPSIYKEYRVAWAENRFEDAKDILFGLIYKNDSLPEDYFPFVHNDIGLAYWKLGKLDSAEYHYLKAERYCLDSSDVELKQLFNIYNNLALIYNMQSRYQLALGYYTKSESLLKESDIRDSLYNTKLSMLYLNRGIAYYNLNDLEPALNDLQHAEIVKTRYNLPYLGSVYFNLARVNKGLGNANSANEYYLKSVRQWILEYDTGYYQLGGVYIDYAQFLISMGSLDSGLFYLNKSLEIYKQTFGNKHLFTAYCYYQKALFYLKQEAYSEAIINIQQAIISETPTFNESEIFSNPEISHSTFSIYLLKYFQVKVKALLGLSGTLDSTNLHQDKKEILSSALAIVKKEIELLHMMQLFYLDQDDRLFLTEKLKSIFTDGIEISSRLYKISNDPHYFSLSFNLASIGKSIEFQFDLIEKQRILSENSINPGADKINELRLKASAFKNSIRLEQEKISPDTLLINRLNDSIFKYKRLHDDLFTGILGELNTSEFIVTNLETNQIKNIQKCLKSKQTLIEFSLSNEVHDGIRDLYTYTISRKIIHGNKISLDTSFFKKVNYIKEQLSSSDLSNTNEKELHILYQSLNAVYKKLIVPIKPFIQGNQLIIVPDEELLFLPFDALIPTYDALNTKFDFMLRDYAISYLLNSQFLTKEGRGKVSSPTLFAFEGQESGDPEIGIKLEGAEKEVGALLKLFNGKAFNEYSSREELLNRFHAADILHFALHAYAQDRTVGAAYLLLDEQDGRNPSGKLYDYEISHLKLNSLLVVLSACGTGSGELYSGEGIINLSRSFLVAGSNAVVSTYWPNEDKSSSKIMISFYEGLRKGKNKSRALQQAKLKYLETTTPTFRHPHFWAGYQLTGNPGRIVNSRLGKAFVLIAILLVTGIILGKIYRRKKI